MVVGARVMDLNVRASPGRLWGSKWRLLGNRCWGFSDGGGVDLGKGSRSLCLSPSHSIFLTP